MKTAEAQAPSAAAEARSTSVGSPEETDKGPSGSPCSPEAAAAAAAGDSCHSERSVGSRCCFCLDLCFYAALALLAAVAGVLYGLPSSHWLHVEVRRAVSAVSSSPVSPSALRLGERLREAALLLEGTAAAAASPYLLSLSSFAYLDAALVGCLTVFSLLLVSALLKGMLAYKREREVEVNPPPIRYCRNQMTLEEYNKKEGTYAAVQELMASPEFQALKAQRASQGSEAWNWQRRVKAGAAAESDEEEDFISSSQEETETETETDTAA